MARDQVDMTPIETRDELGAWLEAGCKPKAQFRVGTEHEKFAFTTADHRPVPLDPQRGRQGGDHLETRLILAQQHQFARPRFF